MLAANAGATISGSSIIIPATGGTQYGPYKAFEAGVYLITINGSNLNNIKMIQPYYNRSYSFLEYNLQSLSTNQIIYKVNVTSDVDDIEFTLRNSNSGSVTIDNITVIKSNNFYYVYTGNCSGGMCGTGGATTSGTSVILSSSSHLTWGSYAPLSKGNYEVTVYGTNVDKISKLNFYDSGLISYTSGEVTSTSSTVVKYKVKLTTDYTSKGVEVYISGSDGNTITIDKYMITKISD